MLPARKHLPSHTPVAARRRRAHFTHSALPHCPIASVPHYTYRNRVSVLPSELLNYIGGAWTRSPGASIAVDNPATAEVISEAPLSTAADVDRAVAAARGAFPGWRRTPPNERVQYLFAFKQRLERAFPEIARTITDECGKTLGEAEGELRRGIENIEVACGIPSLMMGATVEDIASGIDELLLRQPLGVVAVITPFNFPGMIPLWFLPYAIACGNTVVLKPSEKTPVTMARMIALLDELGLPKGVVNLVHGQRETVEAMLDHPDIRAVSFVGSSPVARYVYQRAAASGKRVQCQGGATNPLVVLPDADMEMTAKVVAESAFGCAGQRCLAGSWAVTVGEAREAFTGRIAEAAASRRVGHGADPEVQMGPVISADSRDRIRGLIEDGIHRGARAIVDGHRAPFTGRHGYFLRPSVLDDVPLESARAESEVFGPVLRLRHVATIEEAIAFVNRSAFGNMACLFTTSGAAARQFRYDVQAGNIGINVGVAAPMACFPFSGWKDSFFGDLHAQGRDAIEFYTDKKVVVERWR